MPVGEPERNRGAAAGQADEPFEPPDGKRRGGLEGNATSGRLGPGSGTRRGRSEFLGGRPLKIQTLKVPPAKSSSVQSKNSQSTQIPATLSGKAVVQPIVAKHAVAKDERRRSQRVLLRIRASIHVALQGQAETFDVATLSVNPHGAVVVMKQSLPLETRLVLEHNGTKERVG